MFGRCRRRAITSGSKLTNPSQQLLDSASYLPVLRHGPDVVVASSLSTPSIHGINITTPILEFRAVDLGLDGVHAIVLSSGGQDAYLALLDEDDGRLGWLSADELHRGEHAGAQTRIFSTLCTGTVAIRRETDDSRLTLVVDNSVDLGSPSNISSKLLLRPSKSASKSTRTFAMLPHSVLMHLHPSIPALTSSTSSSASSPSSSSPLLFPRGNSSSTSTTPSRCPSSLTAIHRSSAVAVVPNGCGTASLAVPEFSFGPCCDAHDVCYSSCGTEFDSCNDAFAQCMYDRCDAEFDDSWEFAPMGACKASAFFYAVSVRAWGEGAFHAATEDQCDCV